MMVKSQATRPINRPSQWSSKKRPLETLNLIVIHLEFLIVISEYNKKICTGNSLTAL